MKAIIAGAGIGGLVAGLCLKNAGWQVEVLEKEPSLRGGETGLQIAPNGMRVLARMGVLAGLRPYAFYPESLDLRDGRTGGLRMRIRVNNPVNPAVKSPVNNPAPTDYIQIQRGALIKVLSEGLGAIRFNSALRGVEQSAESITAILQNGERICGDILIGADGVRSAVRRQIFADAEAGFLQKNPCGAWRAVVPIADLATPPPDSGCIWLGRGQHAVTSRIDGGRVVNFVGITDMDADIKTVFADWHGSIRGVLNAAGTVDLWPLYDAKPMARWHAGRAVLLGDACHPMLPSFAQGACQTIESAWVLAEVLARCLQGGGGYDTAFGQYYTARIARVSRVQKASRRNMAMFHRTPPVGFLAGWPLAVAGLVAPNMLGRAFARRQDWLWSFSC